MNPYVLLAKQAIENYTKEGKIIAPPKDLPEEFPRSELAELLNRKAGVFVTIEKEIRGLPRSEPKVLLRGCIGTYLPTKENIAKEIIHNAIAAATEDYRFGPVQEKELPYLSYTIYILSEPELVYPVKSHVKSPVKCPKGAISPLAKLFNEVKDIKDPTKFSEEKFRRAGLDPKKYGIIIKTTPSTSSEGVVFNGHFTPKSALLLPDLEGIDTVEKQLAIACQKGGIDPEKEKIVIYRFSVEKHQ